MSDKKPMYELHKVDENTGRHAPILVGFTGDMRPSRVDEDTVNSVVAVGREHGARPIELFPDGSVQVGHYLYVPVFGES